VPPGKEALFPPRVVSQGLVSGSLSAVATCCPCPFQYSPLNQLTTPPSSKPRGIHTCAICCDRVCIHLAESIDSRSRASLGRNMEATALQQKPLANIRRGSRITDTGVLQRQIPGAYLPSSDPSGPPVSSTQKNLVPVPHRERPPLVAAMAETAGSPIGIANVCCAHQKPSDSVLTACVAAKPAPQNRGQARCCLHDHGGW